MRTEKIRATAEIKGGLLRRGTLLWRVGPVDGHGMMVRWLATLTGLLRWDGRQRLAPSLNRTIPQMSRVPCAGEGNCDLFGEIWRWFAISLLEEFRKGALEVQL